MKISHDFLTANSAQTTFGTSANGAAGTTMSNFATLLQQSRAPAIDQMARAPAVAALSAEKTQASPAAADKNASADATQQPRESDAVQDDADSSAEASEEADQAAAAKPRPAARPRTRGADETSPRATGERGGASHARAESAAAGDAADSKDAKSADADSPARHDGTMPTWIAGWMPGAPNPAVGARTPASADASGTVDGSAVGDATDPSAATSATAAAPGRGRGLPALGAKKGDAREATERADAVSTSGTGTAKEVTTGAGFGSMLAEMRAAEPARRDDAPTSRADTRADTRIDATLAAGATGSSSATSGTDSSTPAGAAQMQAPVDSPEFPKELGVKLSVLAKDGVQHAELHLNPAEMGPVSVQIVMDGTQARIDFGADVAATRQAIEAGLPELASALRDAGFTLAGGGVSPHAGSRQGSDADDTRRDGGARRSSVASVGGAEGAEPAARAVRTRVSAGGVDLYA